MPANKKFQGDFFPDKEGTSRKISFPKNCLKQQIKIQNQKKTQLQNEKSLLHKNSKKYGKIKDVSGQFSRMSNVAPGKTQQIFTRLISSLLA
jgi:hypothetical protein